MPGQFVANPAPQTSPVPGALSGHGLDYRIVIASADGTRHGELSNFDLSRVTWELNTFGSAEFTIPVTDETASLIKVPEREVEIWRGNNILWAGVMVRATYGEKDVNVQCQGIAWYLKHRHIGKANRINFLGNPQFEESAVGTAPVKWDVNGVAASVIESYRILGGRSVELVQALQGRDTFISQTITRSTAPTQGLALFLVGHFFIRNQDYVGPGYLDRGLYVEVRDNAGVLQLVDFVPIDKDTPREVWQRGEVVAHIPPNQANWTVNVRLYAVGGRTIWDACSLTVMESVATGPTPMDQATFAGVIVNHAQDAAYGKSPLRISTNTPDTGIKIAKAHQHTDHLLIMDAINERVGIRDGYEWDIAITPTARTFTTYYPRKMNERSDVVYGLGPTYGDYFDPIRDGITSFSIEVDGEATANSVVVLGEGEGPDREEGGATDTAALGGLTLERVVFSPTGSPIAILDALAYAALERLKRPVTVPSITVRSPVLIGSLNTGDVIRVVIDHGAVKLDGRYRIVRIELDVKAETMTLALNPAEIYESP